MPWPEGKGPRQRPPSLQEEIAYARLIAELEVMQAWWEREAEAAAPRGRPPGRGAGASARTKLTVKFDAEVVKWFRAMGLGYQARMNHVLRSWMLAVLAKETAAEGDRDWKGDLLRGR